MHAPPPFQITVSHFGIWKILISALAASVGMAVAAAWWGNDTGLNVTLAFSAIATLSTGCLASLFCVKPFSLRWDSQQWAVGAAVLRGHEPHSGRLTVAVDSGHWMLLRLLPPAGPLQKMPRSMRSVFWLPIQRRGHEADWHALRCAVYASTRCASDPDAMLPASERSRIDESR